MLARILFFCASVGLVPATSTAASSESSPVQCAEMGTRFAASFKSQYVSAVSTWGNPEFHYNEQLHTCLVYTEVIDGATQRDVNATWYYRRVTDIYSNKVLAYSRYLVQKDDPIKKEVLVSLSNVGAAINLSSAEFQRTKAALFAP